MYVCKIYLSVCEEKGRMRHLRVRYSNSPSDGFAFALPLEKDRATLPSIPLCFGMNSELIFTVVSGH